MLQATCADAVGALFIFLHLLECQTEGIAEFRLGHTKIERRMRTRSPTCLSVGCIPCFGMYPADRSSDLQGLDDCQQPDTRTRSGFEFGQSSARRFNSPYVETNAPQSAHDTG
jgi:hypothetical protein